jgi:hypothetical protein
MLARLRRYVRNPIGVVPGPIGVNRVAGQALRDVAAKENSHEEICHLPGTE